jgi:hypothetical protein
VRVEINFLFAEEVFFAARMFFFCDAALACGTVMHANIKTIKAMSQGVRIPFPSDATQVN